RAAGLTGAAKADDVERSGWRDVPIERERTGQRHAPELAAANQRTWFARIARTEQALEVARGAGGCAPEVDALGKRSRHPVGDPLGELADPVEGAERGAAAGGESGPN